MGLGFITLVQGWFRGRGLRIQGGIPREKL